MIDCQITENYLAEKARMSNNCQRACEWCGLSQKYNKKQLSCKYFELEYPQEAIAIVQKWSDEHPRKTILMDFLEKYPNAKLRKDGTPKLICPEELGFTDTRDNSIGNCVDCWNRGIGNCVDCWNRPLEEEKPNEETNN